MADHEQKSPEDVPRHGDVQNADMETSERLTSDDGKNESAMLTSDTGTEEAKQEPPPPDTPGQKASELAGAADKKSDDQESGPTGARFGDGIAAGPAGSDVEEVHQSDLAAGDDASQRLVNGASPESGQGEPVLGDPKMADVEQLARSVVKDTLEKAKLDAKVQRDLENRHKDPESDGDGWLDIIGNEQLKKKVLTAGTGDREDRPKRSQVVTVRLSARLPDDTEVNPLPDPLTFGLGDGEAITGLDMAIGLMQPGEKAEVFVNARFAYGEKGLSGLIPPDTDLTYTVELLDVQPAPQYEEMGAEERRQIGDQKRERGNWWFHREDYNHAVQCYRRALDFFDNETDEFTGLPDDVHLLFEERLKVHNNMAAAQMKLEAYDAALRSVQIVLSCQPRNVKALFRKGKILVAQNKLADAAEVLKEALKHDPENKTVHQELSRLTARLKKEAESQKSLYRKMLGLPADPPKPSTAPQKSPIPARLLAGGVVVAVTALVLYRLKTMF